MTVEEIVEKTDRFIREVIIPYEKDPRTRGHGPSEDLVRELRAKAREWGLNAPHLPKEFGGHGLTHRKQAAVFKASGYSPLGPVAMNIMAPDEGNMHLIERVGTPEQKEKYLKPLAAGDKRSAFLMTEPFGGAGSDPSMMKTVAVQDGNHWVINGTKTFSTGAEGADMTIIMARTGKSATMFLCDMDVPGLTIDRILDTMDESMPGGHAVMKLENIRLTATEVLGEIDEGFRYAQVRLSPARLTHCMRWWGSARRAHDIAVDYAYNREAFGKKLIDHEGVGFMLADNLMQLKQAELMIDWCADILDSGSKATTESSMAKASVSELLWQIADRCVQVLGGTGVTGDTVVSQIFREIRAFRIYDGPTEVHRWSLANKIKRTYEKERAAG